MDLQKKLKHKIEQIDFALDRFIPSESGPQQVIFDSMRYSIFAGGKRLRPILVLAGCEFSGGNVETSMSYACAMEMIHTYSLIHDDLPSMDNDDYRRGKLTNHKVFGEAIAILAGDGLLNLAYEVMLKASLEDKLNMESKLQAMNEIAMGSGVKGMIGGQVVDILSENKDIDSSTLYFIHYHKTAALIVASIRAGAIIGGASEEELRNLTHFAKNIGYGFQITDDILDIIGEEDKLGKKIGSDLENHKSTYPSLYGLEASQQKVDELFITGVESIQKYDKKAEFLIELAHFLVKRNY